MYFFRTIIMNYIDSYKTGLRQDIFGVKRRKLERECYYILGHLEQDIRLIYSEIVWYKNQLLSNQLSQDIANKYKLHAQMLNACGDADLTAMAFYAGYIHLFNAKTDWEFRCAARRLFTILIESSNGIAKLLGKNSKDISLYLTEEEQQLFRDTAKSYNRFLSDYKNKLLDIRNQTEAHFEDDFISQVNLIWNISAKETYQICANYLYCLQSFTKISSMFLAASIRERN